MGKVYIAILLPCAGLTPIMGLFLDFFGSRGCCNLQAEFFCGGSSVDFGLAEPVKTGGVAMSLGQGVLSLSER
jgi:hypothetical protein